MANHKTPKKSRNFMYEQQLSHLPNGMTVADLYSRIESVLKPKRWAGILHDHDLKDDNITPADDHVHIMMQFENARSVNQVAKDIGDKPQQVVIWDNNVNNGFAYLMHLTNNSRHRHQYSCDEVKANFDYAALINRLVRKASQVEGITSANQINGLLDLVGSGKVTIKDAKNQLSGSAYAKASTKLEKAHELYLERKADELHKTMRENNELVAVHWFYGESETGKTFLAKKLAEKIGDYYMASATKDAFQFYQGEPVVILDELRPESIPYPELLAMFNPFSYGETVVSSRYHNKPLACRAYFVTSPYDPGTFYEGYGLETIDKGIQLYRRLSSVLMFDEYFIYNMIYGEASKMYIQMDKKKNPYSKKNQANYQLKNIYDEI